MSAASPGATPSVSAWQRWLRQPQRIWLRRALFQIHLWAGLGAGLYMLAIGVSGSALVYRPQLEGRLWVRPPVEVRASGLMTEETLTAAAARLYPGYTITSVSIARDPAIATEIAMERNGRRRARVFDPYTGEDLGEAMPLLVKISQWLLHLHDDLLTGETGRLVNGIGGICLMVLTLTGAVIWWPGTGRWRRSLGIPWRAGWRQVTWSLHSALGFWTLLFVLMWGFTGAYLVFQSPFMALVDYLEPFDPESFDPRLGDTILIWFGRVHFGRFGGHTVRVLWIVLGLAPSALFVTGAIMWWNRVVRRWTLQIKE